MTPFDFVYEVDGGNRRSGYHVEAEYARVAYDQRGGATLFERRGRDEDEKAETTKKRGDYIRYESK